MFFEHLITTEWGKLGAELPDSQRRFLPIYTAHPSKTFTGRPVTLAKDALMRKEVSIFLNNIACNVNQLTEDSKIYAAGLKNLTLHERHAC